MKVFFDTNVLISAYTTRGLSADLFRLVLTAHECHTGEVNLREFRRVLRQRFGVPTADVKRAEEDLREHTIIPVPRERRAVKVRDPDDARVLASAVTGGADVLVTGDRDLLVFATAAPLPIMTPRQCWEWLRRTRGE